MFDANIILKSREIKALLEASAMQMRSLGYTEHSFRHCRLVSKKSSEILQLLGADENEVILAKIAGYIHDIGNAVSRNSHPQSGALLAYDILIRKGMVYDDAIAIMMAIASHDELAGTPVSRIAAALILSDKADVHRSRVTNKIKSTYDIHDRVNYAATKSTLDIDAKNHSATLNIEIDTKIGSIMDYFEIFLNRMKMCRNAADFLGLKFFLLINGTQLI
ncbi:MAG: HD domain-containing protein [Saccharofermentanales bacterium]